MYVKNATIDTTNFALEGQIAALRRGVSLRMLHASKAEKKLIPGRLKLQTKEYELENQTTELQSGKSHLACCRSRL